MSQPVNLCWAPFSEEGLEVLQLRKVSWTVYMGLGHMQRSEQVIQQSPQPYNLQNGQLQWLDMIWERDWLLQAPAAL